MARAVSYLPDAPSGHAGKRARDSQVRSWPRSPRRSRASRDSMEAGGKGGKGAAAMRGAGVIAGIRVAAEGSLVAGHQVVSHRLAAEPSSTGSVAWVKGFTYEWWPARVYTPTDTRLVADLAAAEMTLVTYMGSGEQVLVDTSRCDTFYGTPNDRRLPSKSSNERVRMQRSVVVGRRLRKCEGRRGLGVWTLPEGVLEIDGRREKMKNKSEAGASAC